MSKTRIVTIEDDAGGEEQVELPAEMIDLISEPEATTAAGVADLLVFTCAQRIHAVIHHAEDEPGEALAAAEAAMMERFEERFGASFGELTGHRH